MDAALALEPEHGALGMSLREVARHAGVTHAAAYHHFASKEALVLAVADTGYEQLLAVIREPRTPAPFTGRLAAFFRVIAVGVEYVRFALEHPSQFRFMYGTSPVPTHNAESRIADRHAEVLRAFGDVVQEAQRENVIAGTAADRKAAQLWATAHGIATLTLADALDGVPRGSARRQSASARKRRALDLVRGAMAGYTTGMDAAADATPASLPPSAPP